MLFCLYGVFRNEGIAVFEGFEILRLLQLLPTEEGDCITVYVTFLVLMAVPFKGIRL